MYITFIYIYIYIYNIYIYIYINIYIYMIYNTYKIVHIYITDEASVK